MTDLPDTLLVGPFVYTVRTVERLCNDNHIRLRGQHDAETHEILLDSGMTDTINTVTLMHELIHAVEAERDLELDERAVNQLATGLSQVLFDNQVFTGRFMVPGE